MTTVTIVTHTILGGSVVRSDDSDQWYCNELVVYALLAVIGVAMVIIVLVLCLCCRARNHSKQL